MSDPDTILMIFLLIIVITLLFMPPGPGTPLKMPCGGMRQPR